MADVVCVGNLVADVLCSPIESVPASGQLTLTDAIVLRTGGCASNTAVDLLRLGRDARVVGKVGDDLFGGFVIHALERAGVDVSAISRSAASQTSATCIVNVRGEDRRFIHCIGANADFRIADISLSALDGARVLYAGGYLVMPGFEAHDLAQFLKEAKQRGLFTALDVAIPAGKPVGLEPVEPVMPYLDAFLPNDDEAASLTGETDAARQAEILSRLNPDCTVVITRGHNGLLARRRGEVLQAGAYRLPSIDQTGAGDAFAAGFLTGILKKWPLEQTLRFASAVGASCTRALGTTAGVFTFEEAMEFINRNPLEITQIGATGTNASV